MAAVKHGGRWFASAAFSPCLIFRRSASVIPKVSQVDNSSDFLNKVPHRKHPGILHLKSVSLPPELVKVVSFLVAQSSMRGLEEKSQAFSNYLWSRKRPMELEDLRSKAQLIEQKLKEDSEILDGPQSERNENKLQKKILTIMRKTTYHWEEIKYTKELSFLYMVARMDAVFAAVSRAFHEIQKRVPDFQPKTLLDFGSGTGAVSWAAHSIWGNSLKEYINMDYSAPMLALAEQLMTGFSESQELCIPGVYFRQYFPLGPKVTFDLTVSAFSLNELSSYTRRVEAVQNLWRKTSDFLVLVENGTKEGHQILMEARDVVLKGKDKIAHGPQEAHVFAPCPHHLPCPRLSPDRPLPCNFLQGYQAFPFSWNPPQKTERFSFLILRRGSGESVEPWPRITQPVLCRRRHVHLHLCCADGTLQHAVVTPKKHSRDLYRCARNSQCGDRFPTLIPGSEFPLEDEADVKDQTDNTQTAPSQDLN